MSPLELPELLGVPELEHGARLSALPLAPCSASALRRASASAAELARRAEASAGALADASAGAISVYRDHSGGEAPEVTDRRARDGAAWHGRSMVRRLLKATRPEVGAATCGWRLGPAGVTFVRRRDGRAHVGAVESCGSGRLCPVCAGKLAALRAAETAVTVHRWLEADPQRSAVLVTLSPGAAPGDSLAATHDRLLSARAAAMASDRSAWRTFRRAFGVSDRAWTVEHTTGSTWAGHPHVHELWLLSRQWSAEDADAASAWLWREVGRELEAFGFTGGWRQPWAVTVVPVHDGAGAARYLSKSGGVGWELAGSSKDARGDSGGAYLGLPARIGEMVGRRDPRKDSRAEVRRMVAAWDEFAELAEDQRNWWGGFRTMTKLVPELEGVPKGERLALLLALLPADQRAALEADQPAPVPDDDAEEEGRLEVSDDAWSAAWEALAWDRQTADEQAPALALLGRRRRHGGRLAPLELVVCWSIEDHGLAWTAEALAELAGGVAQHDGVAWVVTLEGEQ